MTRPLKCKTCPALDSSTWCLAVGDVTNFDCKLPTKCIADRKQLRSAIKRAQRIVEKLTAELDRRAVE